MKTEPIHPTAQTVIRCILCGHEKVSHPNGCKPIWAKEREDSVYATSELSKNR